jgi:putative sterol carrier protein/multimeric flavodoxin WrbA
MNVNIYYGGRGLVDDPSIFVMNKMQEVLEELRVKVTRYNLYELKNSVSTLPQTLKDANAIILITTVEWYGIGGFMQSFLDACWLYGDKKVIGSLYMFPVAMAKTYGEREAILNMTSAWEILGGRSCNGFCAYVEDNAEFEFNTDYVNLIEKKAEEIYRTVSQKVKTLPTSNTVVVRNAIKDTVIFTPQESEQLSKFISDDTFVEKQKKDIEELTSLFSTMLEDDEKGGDDFYTDSLKKAFKAKAGMNASYNITITDRNISFYVNVDDGGLECQQGTLDGADINARMSRETFESIVAGRMTFQRAFMTGEITARGNLKIIRMFDEFFNF